MTVFVGLDLAWTPGRASGVCVLEDEGGEVRLRKLHTSMACARCFATMCASFGEDVVVAVDAPLVVAAERRAEAELARKYGRFGARAFVANMPFLERMNGLGGPQLARELGCRGFSLDPAHLGQGVPARIAIEVFPAASHVALFGLDKALAYKRGPLANRRIALNGLQRRIEALLDAELPMVASHELARRALDPASVDVGGGALKNLEDRLDALVCAIVAYHCWRFGSEGYDLFGCADRGSIVVPRMR